MDPTNYLRERKNATFRQKTRRRKGRRSDIGGIGMLYAVLHSEEVDVYSDLSFGEEE